MLRDSPAMQHLFKPTLKTPLKAHIVATTDDGLIGLDNTLPCGHCKLDLRFFRRKTLNRIVIMGYNTVVSLPKKLPDRFVVGLCRASEALTEKDEPFKTRCDLPLHKSHLDPMDIQDITLLKQAKLLPTQKPEEDIIFYAGGAKLYEQTLSQMDIVYRNIIRPYFPFPDETRTKHYYPVERLEKEFILINETMEVDETETVVQQVWMRKK